MAIIGCLSLGGGSRKANIATVIQTAYDMVSPERSEVAGGELNAGCNAVTNAAPASASQGGCTDCSLGVFASPRVANPRMGRLPPMAVQIAGTAIICAT